MYYYYNTKKGAGCIKLSVPLFIKLLEYAHEESAGDVDLHWILERVLSHGDKMLTMEHYTDIIPESRLVTVQVEPGQKIEVESINDD